MTTGFDLDEIERLLAAATPVTSSDIMEYEHGGGRLAVISESERTLVADFYGDGADRDCFMAIRLAAPTILTEIRKLRATVATLGDSARAGANVLDVKDAEIRELRAENARLREALGNIRALSAKRQGEGGANETLTHIEGFARQALAVRAELERIADE